MNIKLYQINLSRDSENACFESLDSLNRWCKSVRPENYDEVFRGEVDCDTLESLYQQFNQDERPGRDRFRSMSVSDVIEVSDPETGAAKYYFCDSIGFAEIEFDATKTQPLKDAKPTIRVVLVEPGKKARVADIGASLEGYYNAIGTDIIQAVYPFDEEVCIVCDEEGKLKGSQLNRALRDEGSKEIYDVIAGTFFVCSCKGSSFGSLDAAQQRRYLDLYKWPEKFLSVNGNLMVIPGKPHDKGDAR